MTLRVLADLLQVADLAPAAPRRPGRPRTRTPEYFRALLAAHAELRAWFTARHGRAPRGDRELLTTWCAAEFAAHGRREGRTSDAGFEAKLKTVMNVLSAARTFARTIPGNQGFSGKQCAEDRRIALQLTE